MTPERLRAITYDMNTRPNVTITDRYHATELLAEVKRLRDGIEDSIRSNWWTGEVHADDLRAVLDPTEGEPDA